MHVEFSLHSIHIFVSARKKGSLHLPRCFQLQKDDSFLVNRLNNNSFDVKNGTKNVYILVENGKTKEKDFIGKAKQSRLGRLYLYLNIFM